MTAGSGRSTNSTATELAELEMVRRMQVRTNAVQYAIALFGGEKRTVEQLINASRAIAYFINFGESLDGTAALLDERIVFHPWTPFERPYDQVACMDGLTEWTLDHNGVIFDKVCQKPTDYARHLNESLGKG